MKYRNAVRVRIYPYLALRLPDVTVVQNADEEASADQVSKECQTDEPDDL
jgi:hypothetical protein